MHQNPQDPNNAERRQALRQEEEAFRLQQEAQRLEAAKQTNTVLWLINSVYFLVGLLEILLAIRMILRLLGANTQNTFAQFIYSLSAPFVAPFSTLFVSPVAGGGANIFDINLLIAMIVYAILGWLAVSLIRFLAGR